MISGGVAIELDWKADGEEFFEEIKTEREQLKAMGINLSSIVIPPEPVEDSNTEKDEKGNQN